MGQKQHASKESVHNPEMSSGMLLVRVAVKNLFWNWEGKGGFRCLLLYLFYSLVLRCPLEAEASSARFF